MTLVVQCQYHVKRVHLNYGCKRHFDAGMYLPACVSDL